MTSLFDVRARLSFPEQSRSLASTAEVMTEWARAVAAIVAPELEWAEESARTEDLARADRFDHRHVVELVGTREGAPRGRLEVRLVAGGDATRAGGDGLIELWTVRPVRHLLADDHCDVTHWDLSAAPIDEAQIDGLRLALEAAMGGHRAQIGGERRDPLARGAQVVASAGASDAALWMEDLCAVGFDCRGHSSSEGITLVIEGAALDDLDALERARIALGEVLAEAGHEDWQARARDLLVRLPER